MRFFKTDHGYFHRITVYPRPLNAVAHIHGLAKTQHAEIARPGLVDDDPSSHQWPEWLDLMGMLVKKGYFGESVNPLMSSKESNHIRTACLNFARHRFTLVR